MSVTKNFNLPGSLDSDTTYGGREAGLSVTFDSPTDVELVAFNHGSECPGHLIALDEASYHSPDVSVCNPNVDLYVAARSFTEANLPEGFNGSLAYIDDIPVNEAIETVNGVAVATQTASPSFGAMMVVAACGAIMAVQMVHKAKAIKYEAIGNGDKMSFAHALKLSLSNVFNRQNQM